MTGVVGGNCGDSGVSPKAIRDKPLLAMKMAWGAQKEDRKRKGGKWSERGEIF